LVETSFLDYTGGEINIMNIFTIIVVLLAGLAGSWFHWREVQKRGEPGDFKYYFFINGTDGSIATVAMFAAAMQALYLTGIIQAVDVGALIAATKEGLLYQPFFNVVMAAFMAGYTCDSKLNKSNEPPAPMPISSVTMPVVIPAVPPTPPTIPVP
jgi:hypothetical protein